MKGWHLLGLPLLTIAAPWHANAEQTTADNGAWRFAESTEGCSAFRNTNSDFLFFALRQDSQLVIRAHKKDWKWSTGQTVGGVLSSSAGDVPLNMTTARTSNGWAGIAGLAPESVLDQLASEGPTEIAVTQGMDAKVALPGVAGAASRLKQCAQKLERVPVAEFPVSSPVPTKVASLDAGDIGNTAKVEKPLRFRLSVDRMGAPVDCEIKDSSGDPAIDMRACELLVQQMRFKPALNAAGEPVDSSFQSSVSFPLH